MTTVETRMKVMGGLLPKDELAMEDPSKNEGKKRIEENEMPNTAGEEKTDGDS